MESDSTKDKNEMLFIMLGSDNINDNNNMDSDNIDI